MDGMDSLTDTRPWGCTTAQLSGKALGHLARVSTKAVLLCVSTRPAAATQVMGDREGAGDRGPWGSLRPGAQAHGRLG